MTNNNNNKNNFIFNEDDFVKYMGYDTITQCPFTNSAFHSLHAYKSLASCSTNRLLHDYCFIGHKDGINYHIFKNITMTQAATSKTIVDVLYPEKKDRYQYVQTVNGLFYFITQLNHTNPRLMYIMDLNEKKIQSILKRNWNRSIRSHTADNNNRNRNENNNDATINDDTTILSNNRDETDELVAKVTKSRIDTLIDVYFQHLFPTIKHLCPAEYEIHLPPRDLFDSVLIDAVFFPLKLINFLPSNINFYHELRNSFFIIVQNFAANHLTYVKSMGKYKTRERTSCDNIDYLSSKIYKCSIPNCTNGSFLKNCSKGQTLLPPLPNGQFCRHIFDEALDLGYTDTEILTTWNFKCQFVAHETKDLDSSIIIRSFKILFGRKDPIHKNCMPNSFMDKQNWLNWLYSKKISHR